MDWEIKCLSLESWVGYLTCEKQVFFSCFTYTEERAFETLAEFVMQLGTYNLIGEIPTCMLEGDQLFFPEVNG